MPTVLVPAPHSGPAAHKPLEGNKGQSPGTGGRSCSRAYAQSRRRKPSHPGMPGHLRGSWVQEWRVQLLHRIWGQMDTNQFHEFRGPQTQLETLSGWGAPRSGRAQGRQALSLTRAQNPLPCGGDSVAKESPSWEWTQRPGAQGLLGSDSASATAKLMDEPQARYGGEEHPLLGLFGD